MLRGVEREATRFILAIAVHTKDGLAVVPASPSWDFMAHSYSSTAPRAWWLLVLSICPSSPFQEPNSTVVSSSHSKLVSAWSAITVSTPDAPFYHRVASLLSYRHHGTRKRPTAWMRVAGRSLQCPCWPAQEHAWALCRSVLLCKARWRCPLRTELTHRLRLKDFLPPLPTSRGANVHWCYHICESGVCAMWIAINSLGSTTKPVSSGVLSHICGRGEEGSLKWISQSEVREECHKEENERISGMTSLEMTGLVWAKSETSTAFHNYLSALCLQT